MLRGSRAPIIAGAVAAVLAVLLILFLVLPKGRQVSDAQARLDQARSETSTLQSQLAALEQAKAEAPENKQVIANVQRQIPPTADLPGLLLLVQNAGSRAGVTLNTITPSVPALDTSTNLSTISVSFTANGTYFALTEYLFNLETLPRAAKVLDVVIDPTSSGDQTVISTVPQLQMTGTVVLYTTDTNAGPGSDPGPTESGA
jgi:Tfp pilus assembly protein PilO